jgi:hypothetical protein
MLKRRMSILYVGYRIFFTNRFLEIFCQFEKIQIADCEIPLMKRI